MQFSGALQLGGNLDFRPSEIVLDLADQGADFSNSPTADGNGFFRLTGLDTTFLDNTNYHGVGLLGKSIMCEAKVEAYPSNFDSSFRWGIKGTNLSVSRNNFEIYGSANHYAEVLNARNDITGSGGPYPPLNTVFYYGLHFPNATTIQYSFNGIVCHTETFISGWLTSNGDQRAYFRNYNGSGIFKVRYCATLNTATVADAYAFAQSI